MKKFLLSLFLAFAVPALAQIRIVPPDASFLGCDYYVVQPGHAYSLVEDRYPEDVFFYDFDVAGSVFGYCTAPDWPYEHTTYDLGFVSGLQPLVAATPVPPVVGFVPVGNPNPRIVINESVVPPVPHEIDAGLTHFTISFNRVRGGRYSVETSTDGVAYASRGHEWFVPASRSGLHTVQVPVWNTVFYRVRRVR